MIGIDRARTLALTILISLACVACNTSDSGGSSTANPGTPSGGTASSATACTEPRPQICPEIYMPACGVDKNGAQRTYPNSCHACVDKTVVSVIKGKCASG